MRSRSRRFVAFAIALCTAAFIFAAPHAAVHDDVNAATATQGIPEIAVSELPPQAHETLRLIRQHGPFPHERDGIVFHNREKRLPLKERGYYREYTVRTPGVEHRGARRIVAGRKGEMYYSDDHYRSFRRIRE
jgi:ribonuclease T1